MSSRFIRGFVVAAIPAVLFVNVAYAKKPVELNAHQREARVVLADQGITISQASAAPRLLTDLEYPVNPGTPEEMARQYLKENAELLKMAPDNADLVYDGVVETPVGVHVHFHQKVGETNVEGTDTNISIDTAKNTVYFVMSGYKPQAAPSVTHALRPTKSLVSTASRYLGVADGGAQQKAEQIIFVDADGKSHLATKVNVVSPKEHLWNWDVLVDSSTGKVLRAKDNVLYGKALVFDPNPVIKSGNIYGQGGIVDNNNADSDVLTSLLTEVDLGDIKAEGGVYKLTGQYADSQEIEQPTNPNCDQPSADFKLTRGAPCFDFVNAYYFITKQLKYINETLGYKVMPIKYKGGQKFDAHGVDGDDNSHFDPATGILAFGEGGVDDAQDHDVVLHELGHAIHDYITNGNLSQNQGLSEGVGDYFASSYSRQFMKPAHPAFNWTFSWDGHNDFWPGRVVNNGAHYPDGLQGEVHADGEIWASVMGDVYLAIGKDAADRDMLQALAMTNGTANQNDAANAVLKADAKLFPTAGHADAIKKIFKARGYTIKLD
jgi:Zn-dependent metalloprotease